MRAASQGQLPRLYRFRRQQRPRIDCFLQPLELIELLRHNLRREKGIRYALLHVHEAPCSTRSVLRVERTETGSAKAQRGLKWGKCGERIGVRAFW